MSQWLKRAVACADGDGQRVGLVVAARNANQNLIRVRKFSVVFGEHQISKESISRSLVLHRINERKT